MSPTINWPISKPLNQFSAFGVTFRTKATAKIKLVAVVATVKTRNQPLWPNKFNPGITVWLSVPKIKFPQTNSNNQ